MFSWKISVLVQPCYLIGNPLFYTKKAAITNLVCNASLSSVLHCVAQERAKAQEEYRRNKHEFRQFLESCGFIKVYLLMSS